MVADLLEAHQEGQHQPLAPYPGGIRELLGQLLHRLLVECGLVAAERAERLEFSLVRKVRDYRFIRLQAPQNIRPHQLAQRTIRAMRPVAEALGEPCELFRRSQKSRIDKV